MGERKAHWLSSVVIAVVGFLTGFFFVYLLRGSDPLPEPDEFSDPASQASPRTQGSGAVPSKPLAHRGNGPGNGAGSQPRPAEGGAASTGPSEAIVDTEVEQASRPSDLALASPATQGGQDPHWTALLGKPCRIDFGRVEALVVREGGLTHGQEVLWRRDVRPRRRVGRLAREDARTVVPLAFGIHPGSGRPSAAYIKLRSGGRTLDGVIPLKVGGRYLTMSLVVDGAREDPDRQVLPVDPSRRSSRGNADGEVH